MTCILVPQNPASGKSLQLIEREGGTGIQSIFGRSLGSLQRAVKESRIMDNISSIRCRYVYTVKKKKGGGFELPASLHNAVCEMPYAADIHCPFSFNYFATTSC